MGLPTQGIEVFFLKIFKGIVLLIMGVALISILFLCINAGYQYSQAPKAPAPTLAHKASTKDPVKEINLDNLKQFLLEQEKNKEPPPKQQQKEAQASLLFLEDATTLYRCSAEFGKKLGVITEETDHPQYLIEELRQRLVTFAESPLYGESGVKAATTFTCMALADETIFALKKDEKLKGIFYSILDFHDKTWEKIQNEKVQFEQNEQDRVTNEWDAEIKRVQKAKSFAVQSLIAAGSSFALFMFFALYLFAARIENNLRIINESILKNGKKQANTTCEIE